MRIEKVVQWKMMRRSAQKNDVNKIDSGRSITVAAAAAPTFLLQQQSTKKKKKKKGCHRWFISGKRFIFPVCNFPFHSTEQQQIRTNVFQFSARRNHFFLLFYIFMSSYSVKKKIFLFLFGKAKMTVEKFVWKQKKKR